VIRLGGLTRLVRLLAFGWVALLTCVALSAAPQEPGALADVLRARFASDLEASARQADGVVGYVVIDVESGERFARLDGTQFPTASTIKLAVLYELLKQADEGRVALDAVTPVDRTRAVPGGLLYELTNPSLSARDLAVAMILQSDNTATNVLIDRVGMAAVNQRMATLGLAHTALRRHMIDLEAARRGDENVSTPADLASLVLAFHRGDGLSARSKAIALGILQKSKRTPIRSGVPVEVAVASKSGELEGVRADAGIVYLPGRPYVFVGMATFLRNDLEPSGALDELARLSYEYFNRRATVSAYGRQIR
jgi:beta-lactamase class A